MRGALLAAVLALVLAGPLLVQTSAHGGHELRLRVGDDGCGPDKERCFELESVPVDIEPGEHLTVVLHNPTSAATNHTAYLTDPEDADPASEDTSASAAIGYVGPVEPGATQRVNLTVPDADAVYVWCDLPGHEAHGMHQRVPLRVPDGAGGPDGMARDASLGLAVLVATVASAALLRRH